MDYYEIICAWYYYVHWISTGIDRGEAGRDWRRLAWVWRLPRRAYLSSTIAFKFDLCPALGRASRNLLPHTHQFCAHQRRM